ncbi:MAG: HlyD family secretion protein [Oligoflexales bacterium]
MEAIDSGTAPSQAATKKQRTKSAKWWSSAGTRRVLFVMVILTIAGSLLWWFRFYPYVSTDDARVAMTLAKIAPSGVGGRVEKVNVQEGSHIEAGAVLVEIDHRVPQANYEKAKSRAELANEEFSRMKHLRKEGSASQQVLDQARAQAAAADAELKLAEVSLENTYLKAPFSGVVVQKNAEVGNILEQNQVALLVADDKHPWISANVEETSIGLVEEGQPVTITVDEGGGFEGTVAQIRASVASQFALIPSDSGAGNFTKVVQRVPIKISIAPDPERVLRAGQSVEIQIRVR